MKIGRFVVDAHIHCGKKDEAKSDAKVKGIHSEVESYDNSDQAIFDMDAYGIDMGILLPSFTGTHTEHYLEICKQHEGRFKTCATESELRIAALHGKQKWTLDAAIKELDGYFTSEDRDYYCGIGEFAPGSMSVIRDRPNLQERFKEWCATAEFCVHHDIPCFIHEFDAYNIEVPFSMISEVCTIYPNFKVIIAHGGAQGGSEGIKKACILAGRHEHIYLETGYWRAEFYEFGLFNPDVGAAKLIWGGGDTGSHLWYPQLNPGAVLTDPVRIYSNRNNWVWTGKRDVDYQPNYYGWATHQIHKLLDLNLCTQDEIDLMVGGNACRLYKLPVPKGCTFMAGRPDRNIMPRDILNAPGATVRSGDGLPPDVEYAAGVNIPI